MSFLGTRGRFVSSCMFRSSLNRPSTGCRLKSAAFCPEGTVVVLQLRAHGRGACSRSAGGRVCVRVTPRQGGRGDPALRKHVLRGRFGPS